MEQENSEQEDSNGTHGNVEEDVMEVGRANNQRDSGSETRKFPGETYPAPQRVRFNRGRASRTSNISAHVVINYDVATATPCPCEDRQCKKLVNVGTWGVLGGGSTVCVHCGFERKGDWQGVGYGFMGRKDLVWHLSTARCKAKRGISTEKKSLREVIGKVLYHKINDPTCVVLKEDRNGEIKKYYKCFVCERVVGYRSRHTHHFNANHDTDHNTEPNGVTEGEGVPQED